MAVFVNAITKDGKPNLVNLNNVVNISVWNDNISYTPVYGNVVGGYSPTLVHGKKEWCEIIYIELLEFVSTHDFGIYDAHARIKQFQKEELLS